MSVGTRRRSTIVAIGGGTHVLQPFCEVFPLPKELSQAGAMTPTGSGKN